MDAYSGKLRFEKTAETGASYTTFPVSLIIDSGVCSELTATTDFPLFRDEAEALRDQLDALLNPTKDYVRVNIVGHGKDEWTYEDTTGELQVDDLVRVEFGHAIKIGIVRATTTGRSGLREEQIKPVLAKFTAEEF